MSKLNYLLNEFEVALLTLDRSAADKIITDYTRPGGSIQIANELVTKALDRIGKAWEEGKVALSQVYMSGILCEELIDKMVPRLKPEQKGKAVIAIAAFEDFHTLGKRIIYSSLRAGGFDIIDLGNGLNTADLVRYVREKNIKILLLSVLMLRSALKINQLKEQLSGTGVKIVVGGAPFRFDNQLWIEVGADATGNDPSDAMMIVTKLMRELE